MPTLLVIDDDPLILRLFRQAFLEPDVRVLTAATAAEGLAQAQQGQPDAVVLDINLPDQSGLDTYKQLRELDARVPVLFITGAGTADRAITAMKLGAYDYLTKPLDLDKVRPLVQRAFQIRRLMHVPVRVGAAPPAADASDVLIGRCKPMQDVYKAIGRVAPRDVTVLILGESGTGKELVARAVYQHSQRAASPFQAINCAAIPEALLESELFGHEKGAFTGADRKRIGKFEQCNGGTLFLDEIGDMSPLTQSKILRVLQEQRFERIGGNETIQADVRVIAATNHNLLAMVAANQFRSDLYYRLSVFTIHLPPLRDRGEDLPILVEHSLRRFTQELGKEVTRIDPDALDMLRHYPWPGNLRELQSVLKQALLQATGPVLLPSFLPELTPSPEAGAGTEPGANPDWPWFLQQRLQAGSENLYAEATAFMNRFLLPQLLRHTQGNQVRAARILGISRNSLSTRLKALGITVKQTVATDEGPGD